MDHVANYASGQKSVYKLVGSIRQAIIIIMITVVSFVQCVIS